MVTFTQSKSHRGVICCAAAAAFALGSSCLAAQGDSGASTQATGPRQSQSASASTQPTQGWVLVDRSVVYLFANEPEGHFVQAAADLANKDTRAAAQEVRIASAYLQMQTAAPFAQQGQQQQAQAQGQQSSQQGQQASSQLREEARRLDQLADQLRQGSGGIDAQRLSQAFARANASLAAFYAQDAQHSLQQDQMIEAAHRLRAAATSYRQAATWSRQQPDAQAMRLAGRADQIATAIIGEPDLLARTASAGASGGDHAQGAGSGSSSATSGSQSKSDQAQAAGSTSAGGQVDKAEFKQLVSDLSDQIQKLTSKISSDAAAGGSDGSRSSSSTGQGT